jgi:hypothetical protein
LGEVTSPSLVVTTVTTLDKSSSLFQRKSELLIELIVQLTGLEPLAHQIRGKELSVDVGCAVQLEDHGITEH